MNVAQRVRFVISRMIALAAGTVALASVAQAQVPPAGGGGRGAPTTGPAVARLVADPPNLAMKAGQSLSVKVTAYDAQGNVLRDAVVRLTAPRRAAFVDSLQVVTAITAGSFDLTATAFGGTAAAPVILNIPVTVTWPALSKIEIVPAPGRLYTGVMLAHGAKGLHADGSERRGLVASWRSSDPSVASVDRFGNVVANRPGTVTLTAEAEGVRGQLRSAVVANPVTRIDVGIAENAVRTGDVVHLRATAKRADGSTVADAPITWSYTYLPDDSLVAGGVQGGPGIVRFDRFAANYPGRYTLIAQSGRAIGRTTLAVAPRDVRRRITITGRGTVSNTHSSDLWPWTGKDGRDYCLVGTWGGDGWGLVFDITDMNNIFKTDSIQVNARTINDVTVSPDARYGVLSREGASDRVNGVVILDLATPAHPRIASVFSQELTGGVHNVFATDEYLFAISGGAKYVIIDVRDIYNPKYVSEYRHPNARIHDLWVHDGIAYSAQGGVGTVAVDVGNGKYGGTIEKPKLISTYPVNSGHEIFPYFQQSTGKVYLFIGDEEMSRQGRVWEGTRYALSGPDGKPPKGGIAQTSGGYTHIIDFTDPLKPIPVARYHLEDYGSHDIIVKDDILYQAYYDGGVRLVDVSGELLGNLYDQGREIAVFKPYDPGAYTANAPFVMNAMPWKGHVLFSDFNSGLWAGKLEPRRVVP